ncbi:TrmO family methyltransferase domain-containing protein [Nocardia sp. R7R-8]|uniref:TrmO family methyltransferase domain-containing protein n=1 Tax=Nocardia sp. R7R-8 TaxID=3459304 RepID=UPI00403D9CF0
MGRHRGDHSRRRPALHRRVGTGVGGVQPPGDRVRFHLTDPTDLHFGARSARDNPEWPKVGIFGHRNMRRINWLGVSRCRLLRVDGLDLHVAELDAVDGTPVLDIKPWFAEFGPRGDARQAAWSTEMLKDYF